MKWPRGALSLCAFLLSLATPGIAPAGSALFWGGGTEGSARDLNGPNLWGNSGLFFHDGAFHSLHSVGFGDGAHGLADLSGAAGFGALHAAASGSAFVTGNAGGTLLVEFDDVITLTSTTLAAGTPVSLLFSAFLHDSLYATFPAAVSYSATASTFFRAGGASLTIDDSLASPAPSGSASFVFAGQVGDQVNITGYLRVGAAAFIPRQLWGPDGAASASSDALNTALFQIDSLTPGASFVSDSGALYTAPADSAAVPEPGSLLFFASGFAGLLVARLRRRHAAGTCAIVNGMCVARAAAKRSPGG